MAKTKQNLFFLNYLRAEKIPIDNEEFVFQLETHPEYPSLLSYYDVLNFFNIPNIIVKIKDKNVSNLPDSFVAEVKSNLAFIRREDDKLNVDIGDGKIRSFSIEKFQEIWSGVVLAAESNPEQIRKTKINLNFLASLVSISLVIAIGSFSILLSVFSILIFCGLFFSIESVKQDLNIESDFSNKFCNISTETDCSKIINSKSFKLFNYFGLSDVSISFFIGQLLCLFIFLILNSVIDFFAFSLAILILSIPILITSIFYQWRIAKKWCTICLGIIAVLVAELFYGISQTKEISLLEFNFQNKLIIVFLSSFIISLVIWLFIKPIISSYFNLKSENKRLFKFKRNYNLFKSSLIVERRINYKNIQSDIHLGNKDAKLKLTLVTNPLCKFCGEIHGVIEDLIKKYSNEIRINILFNFKPKEDYLKDNKEIAKLHLKLVDLFFNKNQELFLEALGHWFLNKDYTKWFKEYGEELINEKDCITVLQEQHQQNTNNKIQFTPTVFINEYSYPIIYDKKDILLFIDDLLEDTDIL